MYAPTLKNLRLKLQERKDSVLRANDNFFFNALRNFLFFLQKEPVLSSILSDLEMMLTNEEKKKLKESIETESHYGGLTIPDGEKNAAALYLWIAQYLADSNNAHDLSTKLTCYIFSGTEADEALVDYREQMFLPLFKYFDERVDDSDLLYYLLSKYKRLCEWFESNRLFAIYNQDTQKGELNLDSDLRRFLLLEGIDYPFSTPKVTAGRVDVLVDIDRKPVPIEIKIFDGNARGKSYIVNGIKQLIRYIEEYQQSAGYLVIFNLTKKIPQFGQQLSNDFFPKVEIHNKVAFIVLININPEMPTASEKQELEIITIELSELLA